MSVIQCYDFKFLGTVINLLNQKSTDQSSVTTTLLVTDEEIERSANIWSGLDYWVYTLQSQTGGSVKFHSERRFLRKGDKIKVTCQQIQVDQGAIYTTVITHISGEGENNDLPTYVHH